MTINPTKLNAYLETRSYIRGHSPTQADALVLDEINKTKVSKEHVHLYRWYDHMSSFGGETKKFPGEKPTLNEFEFVEEGKKEKEEPKKAEEKPKDDDELDLFGSEEEEEDGGEKRAQILAAYEARKAAKPQVAAKSTVVFDVKPVDLETDVKEIEKKIREISMDGLVWKGAELIPIAYGIKKLQISCVVEDAKVSTDMLEEQILDMEDMVQSVDIVSFNKV